MVRDRTLSGRVLRLALIGLLLALVLGIVAEAGLGSTPPQAAAAGELAELDPIAAEPVPNDEVLPHEIYRPPAGTRARGVVLVIHGGGWQGGQMRHMDAIRGDARRLASWGYIVWSVDYRSGDRSIDDVTRAYRRIRDRYPRHRVCAAGTSAGGNLALLLAARTSLRCVVDESGPTDLEQFEFRTVLEYFPTPALRRRYSPLSYTAGDRFDDSSILIAHMAEDPLVPLWQSRRFHRRVEGSRLVVLPPGEVPFVHGRADAEALAAYRLIERRHLRRSLDPPARPGRALADAAGT